MSRLRASVQRAIGTAGAGLRRMAADIHAVGETSRRARGARRGATPAFPGLRSAASPTAAAGCLRPSRRRSRREPLASREDAAWSASSSDVRHSARTVGRCSLRGVPLLWRVFAANAAVLVVATLRAGALAGDGQLPGRADGARGARRRAGGDARARPRCCCAGRSRRCGGSPRSCAPSIRCSRATRAAGRASDPEVAELTRGVQRDARAAGERAARQRAAGAGRAGGRARSDRARAARRDRPGADGGRAAARARTRAGGGSRRRARRCARASRRCAEIARRLRPEALDDLGLAQRARGADD